jgi:signal transduction histidine kinase
MTSRLQRWGAFGLRGRIVGAVLVTTVVTLAVAAIVLLPQLDDSLRKASQQSLRTEIYRARAEIRRLGQIDYQSLPILSLTQLRGTQEYEAAQDADQQLGRALKDLQTVLGTPDVSLIGYVDDPGDGSMVPVTGGDGTAAVGGISAGNLRDVVKAFAQKDITYAPYMSFGHLGSEQVVRAAIKLPDRDDAVLAVRKSIDEIPAAAKAVARAFEIAALAGLLLTGLLAIPLAATLARRLQRLREAAQRVAEEGTGAVVPTDRARDEVGDLARSFAIMQRRLSHQEEARRAFVATASHELRTPLASLEGMLELVADDVAAGGPELAEATALLERARAQSRRLSRLAGDLLDLSRIDAEVPLRSESVELGELARAVLAEFEVSNRERGVRASIAGTTLPVWVRADPGKVAQILRILLDNALRIAPRGSEVTIRLGPGGLTVADQGPGVAEAERDLIFERFKRGAATGGEGGFGLGLAIGRELARLMSGDLTLTDTSLGATFALTLPTAIPPAPAETDEPVGAGR